MKDASQRSPRESAAGRGGRRLLCRALLAAAVLAALVALLVPWLSLRESGGATALPADETQAVATDAGAAATALAVRDILPRPTAARPLKIYFGGDSMAGYPVLSLSRLATASGAMRVYGDAVTSSRLCYNTPISWPARLTAKLQLYHPGAVVFMIGANDAGAPITYNGRVYTFWTSTWYTLFRRKVGAMMDIMLRNGVKRIYWVGMPIEKPGDYPTSDQMRRLNFAFIAEAKLRPAVRYIDTWKLLATSTGQFDPRWRATWDPTHLNSAGGLRVASKIMAAIKADWLPPL
jgi:hypothetical protein